MTLAVGAQVGPFEILSPLGAGGMGEVYRARDSRLGREVAIKVLPAAFSADADRLRRFEQEARAAGMLNHPNILTIFEIGTHDGSPYIVSELLEGEELRAHLNHAPLPVRRSLDYARQTACGLAAAHEKGITHRDLKPENLFLTTDGRLKILDFGLAKLTQPQVRGGVASEAPTAMPTHTGPNTVMGTVGYLSPEQVQGQQADHRADIFALGVILYEMLAGRRAFEGTSAAGVMSAILRDEPPELEKINDKVPPQLERIVRRCLEKRPEHRFQSASDLGFALEALSTPSGSGLTAPANALAETQESSAKRSRRRERLTWIVAAVAVLALALAIPYFQRAPAETSATYSSLLPPEKTDLPTTRNPGLAISPDGRRLVMVAVSEGSPRLWFYSFDSPRPQALPGTEGAALPFWSPDSRFIGFFTHGKLKKIEASGGLPITLCDAPVGWGGAWSRDGVIVFAPRQLGSGLNRVSDAGGASAPVTTLDSSRQEFGHNYPCFLPDGRHFVYLALTAQPENRGICVGSLDQQETRPLLRADSNVAYAPPGYLLFARARKLLIQRFDPTRLEVTGDPFTVTEQVRYSFGRYADLSISANGRLVYSSGSDLSRQLTWYDRSGRQLAATGAPGEYRHLELSPDGKRVAIERFDPQVEFPDVWLFDLLREIPTRLTSDPRPENTPLWSPDGSRIVFSAAREGPGGIYQKGASSFDQEELLLKAGTDYKWPTEWSRDGRFIVYVQSSQETQLDLWLLPMFGAPKPRQYLASKFSESNGRVSPDGRWMAYVSDETGSNEVFVQSFPEPGRSVQVSKGGGSHPRWRKDGKELFYLSANNKLMAVAVREGSDFEAGTPAALFEVRGLDRNVYRYPYAVSPDGQRFLLLKPVEDISYRPITIVQNWTALLKQ